MLFRVLQKATELGVAKILPIITDYTIIKIKDFTNKKLRYETIVKEASEQCERTVLPEIIEPLNLKNIDFTKYDKVLLAYERENHEYRLSDALKDVSKTQNIMIIIGPEGGFSEKEIEFLRSKEIQFVSLGKTILRAETAAIYLLSALKLVLEN